MISDQALARFHPKSLNTVRYATFTKDNTVHPLFSFVRFGKGDSVVDNTGSGSIVASIEIDSGIIKTNGADKIGNEYKTHPDTEIMIPGF